MSREDWRRSWKPWLRGTAIGFPLGVLPCGGSVIPTFLSYMVEKRLSAHPEEFGHGAIEGVAGPEAANNAAAAGVLVPLLTLGLPSSATAAILLAAFQQYGLQPGPLLFSSRPDLVWTLIASLYIGNVMLLVLNLPLAGVWARVMLVPRPLLFGGILVLASLGAYSLNRSLLDLVLLYVGRRRRLRDARLRRAARAGGARPRSSGRWRSSSSAARWRSAKAISRCSSRGRSARRCSSLARRRCSSAPSCSPLARRDALRRHDASRVYDVAVLGGGNAGLCAALTAREAGARVIVARGAPRHFRGGNSRHTRNLRCVHAAPTAVLTDAYSEDEFLADLLRVTGGETDEALARLVVRASADCPAWMRRLGVAVSVVAARHAASRRAPTRSSWAAARR